MMQTTHKLPQPFAGGHNVDGGWRDDRARALESRARAVADLIDHLEDVEAASLDEYPKLVDSIRATSALARTARRELEEAARLMRAD